MIDKYKDFSDEVRDVLSNPPKSIYKWGNTIMFAFFAVLILLVSVIKHPDIIVAQAVITTRIPPEKIYSRFDGMIDTIIVEDNQIVSENEVLAVINNPARFEDVLKLKDRLNKIDVYIDLADSLNFQEAMLLGEIEDEFSEFENSYLEYYLDRRLKSYQMDSLSLKESLTQMNSRTNSLANQKNISEENISLLKKEYERNLSLFNKGVVSLQELELIKRRLLDAEKEFEEIMVLLSQTNQSKSSLENDFEQLRITKIKSNIGSKKKMIQAFQRLKKAIKDWEIKFILKSNIRGTVTFFEHWQKYQTIKNGDLVFTVVPENTSNYIAKILAPKINSGKIGVNQEVKIKLDNYPYKEYGSIRGKVESISLTPNQEGMYVVTASLPYGVNTKSGTKTPIFSNEMSGQAEIVTEELRLITRIFYQFRELNFREKQR